jgi:oligosaccharide repeat unit polymerase
MRILYFVLLLVLLGTFGLALNTVRKRFHTLTPILGWMVGLSYFVLVPLTILTLNGGYKTPLMDDVSPLWGEVNLSNPVFLRPYFVIWLSMILICAVIFLFCPGSAPKETSGRIISRRRLEQVILVAMALSVLDWIMMIWLAGGFADFLVSHWYLRNNDLSERFGAAFTLYARVSLCIQIIFTGAAALHTSLALKDRKAHWKFTSLILFFFVIEMVMRGNRIFIAIYLLALLASCWLYGRKKIVATALVVSPIFILVFSVWAEVRHDVSRIPESVSALVEDADESNGALSSLMHSTEGSAVMLLMHLINDFGNRYDYLYGSTYSRLFTFFVPRSIYPSRPVDFTNLAASLYEPGEITSLNSTALGEAWANFGPFGIFVLPFFTWFALRFSERLTSPCKRHTLLSAVSFVVFIWFARATFAENAMTLIGAALLIWMLRLERGLSVRTAAGKTPVSAGPRPVLTLTPAEPSA